MKIFISWSGIRSKYVADALRGWIPKVLQAVKPWMSDEDISMGTRWALELSNELEETKVGIVCLTPENQHSSWIMFEAGALSKTIEHSYVCPYLIDLPPSQLSGPMSQFQAATATKEGTERMLNTLNKALGISQIPPMEFEEIFDVWWPKLEQQLNTIPTAPEHQLPPRSTEEILEEIVRNTREHLRRDDIRTKLVRETEDKYNDLLTAMEGFTNILPKLIRLGFTEMSPDSNLLSVQTTGETERHMRDIVSRSRDLHKDFIEVVNEIQDNSKQGRYEPSEKDDNNITDERTG
jgi:hypothetical protein